MRQLADQAQVLAAGEVLVDRGVLAGETDDVPHLLWLRSDVESEHPRRPLVGPGQRREHTYHRGLAGAVRSEQAEHTTFRYLERHPAYGLDVAEALHQSHGGDRGLAARPRLGCHHRDPTCRPMATVPLCLSPLEPTPTASSSAASGTTCTARTSTPVVRTSPTTACTPTSRS